MSSRFLAVPRRGRERCVAIHAYISNNRKVRSGKIVRLSLDQFSILAYAFRWQNFFLFSSFFFPQAKHRPIVVRITAAIPLNALTNGGKW